MAARNLLEMTNREKDHAMQDAEGCLDIIVHPGFSIYMIGDYQKSSSIPVLHGSLDDVIMRIQERFRKFDEADDVPPLPFSTSYKEEYFRKHKRGWKRSLYLMQAMQHYVQGADILNESMAILELNKRKKPALLILPKGGLAEKQGYDEFITALSYGTDRFMAVESREWNDGYLFDCGDRQFPMLADFNEARNDPRMIALAGICADHEIHTLRLWGGYINQCLLSAQRSLAILNSSKVFVDLERSSSFRRINRQLYVSHKPGFWNPELRLEGDDSINEIHRGLNALLEDVPCFYDLTGAIGKEPEIQDLAFRSYGIPYAMKDRFKHLVATLHPNDNKGPMLGGMLQPASYSRQ